MSHISEQKKLLRQEIEKRIDAMSDAERLAEGRTVSRILLKLIPPGSTVCAYVPLKNEADIRLLLTELLRRGDTLFLPVFEKQKLIFRKAENLKDLPLGELSIPEPPKEAEKLNGNPLDIILVPGRAFDRKGNRLGRGSGGYDQWIAEKRSVLKTKDGNPTAFWGVCLQCQLLSEIPTEPHDAVMDAVVTANEEVGLNVEKK